MDLGDEQEAINDLPITVKEVLSVGEHCCCCYLSICLALSCLFSMAHSYYGTSSLYCTSPHRDICMHAYLYRHGNVILMMYDDDATAGPGLVKRSFLIEISANSGTVLGTAAVEDTYEDMCLVVGRSFLGNNDNDEVGSLPLLLPRERRDWKLGLLFAHIVRERTSIDMMPGGGRDFGFDNDARRVGVLDNNNTNNNNNNYSSSSSSSSTGTGSIIRIHRDSSSYREGEEVNTNTTNGGDDAGHEDTKTSAAAAGVAVSSSSSSTSHRHQRHWFRIHARTHRMFGCPLRSVVLLLTTDRTAPLFFSDADQFFRTSSSTSSSDSSDSSNSSNQVLRQFDVLFRCKNSFTKEVRELLVPSLELSSWLSVEGGGGSAVVVDLTTSFRRDKLGSYLLDYVSFRYLPDEHSIDLYLVKEDAQVTSSIDQLMEEDEQRQLEDENRTTF